MTRRQEDQSFITTLRRIEDRLSRLEMQNNAYRKNDVRLSGTIVSADTEHDELSIQNLHTDRIVKLGGAIPMPFSLPGDVSLDILLAAADSPPWHTGQWIHIVEIGAALTSKVPGSSVTLDLMVDDEVMTTVTLDDTTGPRVRHGFLLDVGAESRVWFRGGLVGTEGLIGRALSCTVWYKV